MLPEANSQGAGDMGVTPLYLPGYKHTGEGSLKGYHVPDKVKCLFLANMEVPDYEKDAFIYTKDRLLVVK